MEGYLIHIDQNTTRQFMLFARCQHFNAITCVPWLTAILHADTSSSFAQNKIQILLQKHSYYPSRQLETHQTARAKPKKGSSEVAAWQAGLTVACVLFQQSLNPIRLPSRFRKHNALALFTEVPSVSSFEGKSRGARTNSDTL